jgi:hypothetical protein
MLKNALKSVGEQLGKLLEKSSATVHKIKATTKLGRYYCQNFVSLDFNIDRFKYNLSFKVEILRKETGDHAAQLQTLQRHHEYQERRFFGQTYSDRLVSSQSLPPQPATKTSLRRQNMTTKSPFLSIEVIIHRRRGLIAVDALSRSRNNDQIRSRIKVTILRPQRKPHLLDIQAPGLKSTILFALIMVTGITQTSRSCCLTEMRKTTLDSWLSFGSCMKRGLQILRSC